MYAKILTIYIICKIIKISNNNNDIEKMEISCIYTLFYFLFMLSMFIFCFYYYFILFFVLFFHQLKYFFIQYITMYSIYTYICMYMHVAFLPLNSEYVDKIDTISIKIHPINVLLCIKVLIIEISIFNSYLSIFISYIVYIYS